MEMASMGSYCTGLKHECMRAAVQLYWEASHKNLTLLIREATGIPDVEVHMAIWSSNLLDLLMTNKPDHLVSVLPPLGTYDPFVVKSVSSYSPLDPFLKRSRRVGSQFGRFAVTVLLLGARRSIWWSDAITDIRRSKFSRVACLKWPHSLQIARDNIDHTWQNLKLRCYCFYKYGNFSKLGYANWLQSFHFFRRLGNSVGKRWWKLHCLGVLWFLLSDPFSSWWYASSQYWRHQYPFSLV